MKREVRDKPLSHLGIARSVYVVAFMMSYSISMEKNFVSSVTVFSQDHQSCQLAVFVNYLSSNCQLFQVQPESRCQACCLNPPSHPLSFSFLLLPSPPSTISFPFFRFTIFLPSSSSRLRLL